MDRMEDLLGMPLPLYYRLILIEGGVKSSLIEVYSRSVCGERRFEMCSMNWGDLEKNLNPSPINRLVENYLRTAPKRVASIYLLRFHSISYRLTF
jgi:hypothetical protein